MRVAVNGWFWNAPATGSGQYVRRLTKALAATPENRCPNLHVFVPDAVTERDQERAAAWGIDLQARPIQQTHLRKVWWEQFLMPRYANQYQADLLHVPYWAPPTSQRGASHHPATVVTVHDLIPLLLPAYRGGIFVRAYSALVSTTTRYARLILTDSDASRSDILAHLKVEPDHVRAIPLAVDSSYSPEPTTGDAAVLDRLKLRKGYLLYLGGFDQRKNLHTLFSAFHIVQRAWDEAQLVVAGRLPSADTDFSPDPRRLAREAELPEESVRFLGFVDEADKPALLRGARAFVFPSEYEGFGYPCLEAIACGTPVIGSQAASLPEVVGPAGVLLHPHDYEGMAGALLQTLVDDAFHAALQQAAIEQARRFSWARTATETLSAFREALGGF